MTSFKGGFCERCLKHVSLHEDDCIHTCTPTKGWRAMEQRLEAQEKLIEQLSGALRKAWNNSTGMKSSESYDVVREALAAAKVWKDGV